jgi:hypothetical protein
MHCVTPEAADSDASSETSHFFTWKKHTGEPPLLQNTDRAAATPSSALESLSIFGYRSDPTAWRCRAPPEGPYHPTERCRFSLRNCGPATAPDSPRLGGVLHRAGSIWAVSDRSRLFHVADSMIQHPPNDWPQCSWAESLSPGRIGTSLADGSRSNPRPTPLELVSSRC